MRREHIQPQSRPQRVDEDEVTVAARTETSNVDDLLDEIDGVLEENAESFVQGFVQKGGQ